MDLELTRIFVKVVQQGSFSRAADLLKVPKSTVSKAITRMEKETGTKLLLRTTRSLTMTASGRVFFDASLAPVQALEDAQKALYGKDSILSGQVKITAPEDLGIEVIAPAIASLARKHAGLGFELLYTDTVVDLVKDGFDMAVRIGRPAESSFKAKRLGEVILIPVASPKYLQNSDKIRAPKDLEVHTCLSYRDQGLSSRWNLRNKKESAQVHVRSRILSNQMTSLLKMAVAGAGVALVPHYLCRASIAAGELEYVLRGWGCPDFPVYMITPLSVSSSARLKITADFLAESIERALAPE